MADKDNNVGSEDLRSLVLQLVQEVQGLKEQLADLQVSDRLDDLEGQLVDLGCTEVRLQARRSSIAVSQLQLPLAHLGCSSAGGTAAASPRVAGPLSASVTPRGKTMATAAAAGGANNNAAAAAAENSHGLLTAAVQSSRDGSKQAAHNSSSGGIGSQAGSSRSGATAGAATGTPTAAKLDAQGGAAAATPSEPHLGLFEAVKHWGEEVLDSSDELKKATQLVTTAAAAAAEAQAAASRCQQQVLELRGRQGQAERRLDTLWQLQETSSQNQAALSRVQQDLQQGQQQLQQQQQNMVAVRAQIQQLDGKCDGNSSTSSQLRQILHELQQQVDGQGKDVQQVQDQMVQQQQSLQASKEELHGELGKVGQQLQQQLDEQQQALASCAGAAGGALDKCEQLRQGAVVMAGRMDWVSGQIQETAQPLKDRLTAVETTVASWSSAAALSSTAVQQGQLTAALAQLSAAATRQAHELTAQLSGLTARLEVLEGEAARQAQVVMQDEFKRQLSKLHSDIEVAVLTATNPMLGQIKAKADLAQLNSSGNSLSARLSASEKSLLLGLKSVGDKTALLLQHKADAAAFDAWKQQTAEDMAQIRAELVQAVKAVHAGSAHAVHAVHASFRAAAGGQDMLGTSSAEQAADAETAGDAAALVLPLLSAAGCSAEQQKAAATGSGHQHSVGECVAAAEAALGTPRSPQEQQAVAPAAAITSSPSGGVAAMIVRPLTGGTGSFSHDMAASAKDKLSGVQAKSSAGSKQRPPSVQPWASSSPTPAVAAAAVSDIHSAAHNAKLAKAARDKQSARARALQSKGLVAALMHSSAAPSPSEVDEALQHQLNVMGITAAAGTITEEASAAGTLTTAAAAAAAGAAAGANDAQQGRSRAASAGAEAAGQVLESALAAGAAAAAAGTLGDSTDGTGRLVLSAGSVGLGLSTHNVGRLLQPHSAAEAARAVGTLSATGLTFSLRQQSATNHNASGAASSKAAGGGLFRTGSVGLPVRTSMSAVSQQQQQLLGDRQQLQMQQSPTAEELRALLRSGSAGGSKGSAAAMPAVSVPGSSSGVAAGSNSGSGSSSWSAAVVAEQQVAATVGRLSPITYIKQTSGGRRTQQ